MPKLLIGEGLDRERGIFFRIDPAVLKYIPEPSACTPVAVAAAYRFLNDEWLGDVETDAEGKAVLIALPLTIIERVLLPERPVFYVTAGLRGTGKTTALHMASLAALGVKAAAMAWTNDGEERKKALYSVLREALPFLVWDNIPRGTVIGCPHIERASTAETYKDRVLGESASPEAPAFTIMAFTGNNIRPKSDSASRSLIARLGTERPDPENRAFAHNDPIAWTLDHRGAILNAFYTIMLGNPPCAGPGETRFKRWWRLVGSAVENAAFEATGAALSFKDMFERVEAEDEDAISRGAVLETLCSIWPNGAAFTTGAVAEHLNAIATRVKNGADEDQRMAELRRFCTAPKAAAPSPKAITRALKSIEGAPTAVEGAILNLSSGRDTHTRATTFTVVKREKKPQ
jgi:hypothetical protein